MLSIIIPIYGVEKYLRDCIDSVLAQTYKDIEVILVDDGSPDRCGEICDEYARSDSRVTVIHKENGGLSDARNAGLEIAQGEYILFVDSDDMIKKKTAEHLLECIKRENAQIVYYNAETLYEDFENKDHKEELIRKHSYKTCKGAYVLGFQRKNNEFYAMVQLNLFERKFIETNKLRFKKGIIHEDELFSTIAYVKAQKTAYLNEALYIRRMRAGSIMSEVMSGRISIKGIEGITACVEGILKEYKLYSPHSTERKALLISSDELTRSMLIRYASLDRRGRKSTIAFLKRALDAMTGISYSGSKKTKFKLAFPEIFVIIRKIKSKLKAEV